MLTIADIATTYVGIKVAVSEQNRTAENIFSNYGFAGFAVVKIIATLVLTISFFYLYSNGLVKTIPLVLIGLNGAGLLVIVNNLVVILGKREIYDYSDFSIFIGLIFLSVMFLSIIADDIGKKLHETF